MLPISFKRVSSILKKKTDLKELIQFQRRKTAKNGQKSRNCAIETFTTLVVSMVISPLLITVAEFKIDAVSSKFCLVSRGLIIFLVTLMLFEKIQFY